MFDGQRPNGLPISCAATTRSVRTPGRFYVSKKPRSRGRAAALTAWACSALRSRSFERHPHLPTTPEWYHACTTGVRSPSRPSGTTPGKTGVDLNHAHLVSALPQRAFRTTGARTTSAQRAPARRSWHNGRSGSAIWLITSKKECRSRSPNAERPGLQRRRSPRSARRLSRFCISKSLRSCGRKAPSAASPCWAPAR